MLRAAKDLHGVTLHALDGEIGSVDEILFDDQHWTVRYLIVNTGGWLSGRKVLISPIAFGLPDWERNTLNINLTRAQIENSPGIESDKPVSRQWEANYYDTYAWPYYWGGAGVWGSYWYPALPLTPFVANAPTPQQRTQMMAQAHADSHLRSTKEVSGYGISATDGHIGHIQDFFVNDQTWRIAYLAVDTRDWWPGKTVLLPPNWITGVSWPDRRVNVNVTRAQVQNAPEWDTVESISRSFEDQLYAYYSRRRPSDEEHPQFATVEQSEHQAPKETEMLATQQREIVGQSEVVAIYDTHNEAEMTIRDLQRAGFDMTKLSIVGKNYHSDEEVVGYYTTGDRMLSWGATGAFWGGIWSLLFGSAFFFIPGVGPIMAAGPIVVWIVGALEGATVVGGLSVLGAALVSMGIPKDSILQYETQVKAGKFVVIAHDIQSAQEKAMITQISSRHNGQEQSTLHVSTVA